jgi:hypothetical protein
MKVSVEERKRSRAEAHKYLSAPNHLPCSVPDTHLDHSLGHALQDGLHSGVIHRELSPWSMDFYRPSRAPNPDFPQGFREISRPLVLKILPSVSECNPTTPQDPTESRLESLHRKLSLFVSRICLAPSAFLGRSSPSESLQSLCKPILRWKTFRIYR